MFRQSISIITTAAVILFASEPADSQVFPDSVSTEDAIIAIQKRYHLPSLCLALVSEDSVLIELESGTIDGRREVSAKQQYQIGSLSKSFTSYAAACLVEEGVISWDAKLLELVPELKESARGEYKEITLADLLSHRAGFPDYTEVAELNALALKESGTNSVLLVKQLIQEKPASEGTFLYSNVGYSAAALMLERASNNSWEELIRRYIGVPYGIEYSLGYPQGAGVVNPAGHVMIDGAHVPGDGCALPPVILPSGGISMSLENLIIWSRVHLELLNGKSTLSEKSRNRMYFDKDQKGWYSFPYYNTFVTGYAMGWFNFTMGDTEYIGHSGTSESYYASIGINLDKRRALVFMTNAYSDSVEAAAREICALIDLRTAADAL